MAQPVAERSCCAANHAGEQNGAAAKTPTVAADHSCCARKSAAPPKMVAPKIAAAGCCCEKGPPAVPASRDAARTTAEQGPQMPVVAVVDLFDAAPAARGDVLSTEARPLFGPQLLALYCIWRK